MFERTLNSEINLGVTNGNSMSQFEMLRNPQCIFSRPHYTWEVNQIVCLYEDKEKTIEKHRFRYSKKFKIPFKPDSGDCVEYAEEDITFLVDSWRYIVLEDLFKVNAKTIEVFDWEQFEIAKQKLREDFWEQGF